MNPTVHTPPSPDTDGVLVSAVEAGVTVIEFSRPPLNFFDIELVSALADRCFAAAEDGARALVLAATGKVFCAGADFGSESGADPDPAALYEQAVRLFRQPLPLVVAVQGAAIGGGLGLALAGDFRVASHDATFAANFTALGIHPGFGLSVTLPRAVGHQAAADLFYTGRRIDAAEARSSGLVDRVSEPERVRADAIAYASRIAAAAPLAVRAVRRTLRGDLADQVAAAVVLERAEQMALFTTDDFAEGVAAVRERRPGRFTGR